MEAHEVSRRLGAHVSENHLQDANDCCFAMVCGAVAVCGAAVACAAVATRDAAVVCGLRARSGVQVWTV